MNDANDHETERDSPDIWLDTVQKFCGEINKCERGHTFTFGAGELIGAICLSTPARSGIDAELTIVSSNFSTQSYPIFLPADVTVKECSINDLKHVSTALCGPGGISKIQMKMLLASQPLIKLMIDSEALTEDLKDPVLGMNTVLTPDNTEFEKGFGELPRDPVKRYQHAGIDANCTAVKKGAEKLSLSRVAGALSIALQIPSWQKPDRVSFSRVFYGPIGPVHTAL